MSVKSAERRRMGACHGDAVLTMIRDSESTSDQLYIRDSAATSIVLKSTVSIEKPA